MAAPRILSYDFDVVTRRVNRSCSSIVGVLDVVGSCTEPLRVDRPFGSGSGTIPVWDTTGRLYSQGLRIVRFTRVHLEVTAWSEHATELRMRPVTRRASAWGRRRQRCYFALAHSTIDELTRALDVAAGRRDAITARVAGTPNLDAIGVDRSGLRSLGRVAAT